MASTGIVERIVFGRPQNLEVESEEPLRLVARPRAVLIGRILIAAIFLVSGFAKLTDLAGTAGYMTAVGIPNASVLAAIAGIAEIAGGIAIALGIFGRLGALGLIALLIPTTVIFHGFWRFEGAEAKAQMVNFMKNLAIIGGLVLLYAQGPGALSVDAKLRRPVEA